MFNRTRRRISLHTECTLNIVEEKNKPSLGIVRISRKSSRTGSREDLSMTEEFERFYLPISRDESIRL